MQHDHILKKVNFIIAYLIPGMGIFLAPGQTLNHIGSGLVVNAT